MNSVLEGLELPTTESIYEGRRAIQAILQQQPELRGLIVLMF